MRPRAPWICCALLLAVPALAGCTGRVDPALYPRFQAAQAEFERASGPADFLRAAALYQEILDTGTISGAVLYNQGNAFMRAGQAGRALACYQQARRFRPRDPFLDANLRYARDQLSQPAPKRPVIEYLLFWQNWIGYPAKFRLSLLAGAVTFGLAVGGLFVWRSVMRRLALAALLGALVVSCSAAYDWYRFEFLEHGVVVAGEVVVRKGNATSYAPAFTQPLVEGSQFRVVDRRGDWLLIRLADAGEGWLRREDVVLF